MRYLGLVVDVQKWRALAMQMLLEWGEDGKGLCAACACDTGHAAMAKLCTQAFDVVLVDQGLPALETFLAVVRCEFPEVPIVLTGSVDRSALEKAHKAYGTHGILGTSLPPSLQELRAVLASFLQPRDVLVMIDKNARPYMRELRALEDPYSYWSDHNDSFRFQSAEIGDSLASPVPCLQNAPHPCDAIIMDMGNAHYHEMVQKGAWPDFLYDRVCETQAAFPLLPIVLVGCSERLAGVGRMLCVEVMFSEPVEIRLLADLLVSLAIRRRRMCAKGAQ